MQAGRLPDLQQELDLDEVLAGVDASDWWYRRQVPALPASHNRAWLTFAGIDYQAAVTVNGHELGRRAGMYAPRRFEITPFVQGQPATVAVRVWGGGALPQWPRTWRLRLARWLGRHVQQGLPAFDDRLLTLKAPMHFGWDFSPRLLVAGLWDDVILHTARDVGLLDVWSRADWGPDAGLMLSLHIDAANACSLTVEAELSAANFDDTARQSRQWQVEVRSGEQTIPLAWPEAELKPWQSHDRGFPHLYRLHVRLRQGADLLDEMTVNTGSRQIGWGRVAPGLPKVGPLYLNGQRLPLRGINWVPLDLLPGDVQAPQRYRRLLQAAVAAGVNAIRVWGGGGRERRLFYDLCDELGLLVWQEMPIACVFFDALPADETFLTLVRQETRGIVRSLRRHPSIMLWAGGNEWGPGRHRRVAAAMSETVSKEDPGRRWLPASPGPGDSHNWQVWHEKASPWRYTLDPAPLLSEFGHAAPPPVETLQRMMPDDQIWPPGPAWQARKAEWHKLAHYAAPFLYPHTPDTVSLEAFVAACQQAQARALQIGAEHYRLRTDAVGSFVWQWNEPWPAICWSIWPYEGAPKAAYRQLAASYAPVAIVMHWQNTEAVFYGLNDTGAPLSAAHCRIVADETELWQGEVSLLPGKTLLTRQPLPAQAQRLTISLQAPALHYENDYDLAWLRAQDRSAPGLWQRLQWRIKHWLLRW